MTIFVNGEARELEVIGKNGIEWTNDLLGSYDALHYDEEQEVYAMSEDDFAWWKPVVDMLNEINELEEELGEDAGAEYETENFDYSDLDDECRARLGWLKSRLQ